MGAQMRKVLAVFAALAVAAGVVVFWQPIAAAGDAVAPAAHHPITRGVPGQRQAAGLLASTGDSGYGVSYPAQTS
jgi:hypothetical protein